tara:strand:+ start:51 stop:509 length:459 start_codon:yes stop_codon:yes gene_type:complete
MRTKEEIGMGTKHDRGCTQAYKVTYDGVPRCICGKTDPNWVRYEQPEKAFQKGEDAIAQVDKNEVDDWKERALEAVQKCAKKNETFIVDDVWKELEADDAPHIRDAIGPVMRRAVKAGYMEATDRHRPSQSLTAHRLQRRIWMSLIYKEELE